MVKKRPDRSGYREVKTFAYLVSAAQCALDAARAQESGSFYMSMHAILASVHSVEAYLNHLGPRYFNDWDEPNSGLRAPKDKFEALRKKLQIEVKFYSSFYDEYLIGLDIRDDLVHGTTHNLKGKWVSNQHGVGSGAALKTEWEKRCNPKTAGRIFDGSTKLINVLGEACGEPQPYLSLGSGGSGPVKS